MFLYKYYAYSCNNSSKAKSGKMKNLLQFTVGYLNNVLSQFFWFYAELRFSLQIKNQTQVNGAT